MIKMEVVSFKTRICKKQISLKEKALSLDRFAYPVTLNVNGHTEIRSLFGSFMTVVFFIILSTYALQKFQ